MGFFPFAPQSVPVAGGTFTGPVTIAGLLTTQAGITNGGGNVVGGNFVTVSGGNLTATNGPLDVSSAGQGLKVAEGANAKQGTGILSGGTLTVANTSVTASSRILVTSNLDGGTPGFLRVSARVAGTSFTVTSSSGTDTSTFAYEIFEPG